MRVDERDVACRRQFLKVSAFGAAAGMASSALSASANQAAATQEEENPTFASHRLQRLSLLTATPLPEMAAFYEDVLEMDVQLNKKSLVVEAGGTQITFSPAPRQSQPYYHFAFNIPENKILSARSWLGERTKLAVTPKQQRFSCRSIAVEAVASARSEMRRDCWFCSVKAEHQSAHCKGKVGGSFQPR